ncbi:unnamed protein product [Schistosoma rodhaini]|uniref:G-protein coupled receptors family 1 profile domain-containing protein n=1 Tax=Schistosoma rodhaini TaxID=6188 RepID=A0AA85GI30_9TREM|nr:unnamed protein product [Schistosoma rodhaini]
MTSFGPHYICDYIKHSTILKSFSKSTLLSIIEFMNNQSNNMEKLLSTDHLLQRYTNDTTYISSSSSYIKENQLNTLLNPIEYNSIYHNYPPFDNNIPFSIIILCSIIDYLWNYIPPLIFLIGTIGNLFTFLIFYKLRTTLYPSSNIYLLFLSIIDECVLFTGLLRRWLDKLLNIRLEDKHWLLCKAIQFIGVTTSYISVWIIVLITIERTIVIISPISSIYMNHIKRSYIFIISLCCIATIISLHFFFTVNLVTMIPNYLINYDHNNNTNSTLIINENYSKININYTTFLQVTPNYLNYYEQDNINSTLSINELYSIKDTTLQVTYDHFHDSNHLICDFYLIYKQNGFQSIWIWIDATLYSYLPFIIILIFNILILINLYWATKKRFHLINKISSKKFLYQYTTDNDHFNNLHHHHHHYQDHKKMDHLSMKLNQSSLCSTTSIYPRKHDTLQLQMITPQTPSTPSMNSCHIDEITNTNMNIFHTNNSNNNIDINLCKCKHPIVAMQLKPSNYHHNLKGIINKTSRSNPTIYSNEMRQLTILLMLISCIFLITTAPIVLIKLLLAWKLKIFFFKKNKIILLEFIDCIAELLMYINHAINFYLYCAVGTKFRKEFKKLFGCQLKKRKNLRNW